MADIWTFLRLANRAAIIIAALAIGFYYHPTATQNGTTLECGTAYRPVSKDALHADLNSRMRIGAVGTNFQTVCRDQTESLIVPIYAVISIEMLTIASSVIQRRTKP